VPLLATAGSPASPPRARFGTAVAYHLDNRRFVAWLQRQAERAGVERVSATVAEVRLEDDHGDDDAPRVAELVADDGRRFTADLYVDCTGFRALLAGDALGSPFVPFTRSLFTDRAVVATQPLDGPPPPYTRAETWDAGWCWSTPQRREDHRGYVYASAFLSDDDAVAELRRRLPAAGEPRVLRFRSGRRTHFLRGNVAALGNAYGFVEPLESTALHLLIRQIGLLLGAYPWHPGGTGRAALLNRTVAGWWDYLAWFLALHYRFNGRLDTPFWCACRAEVDVTAWGELLDVYRQSGLLSADPAVARSFDAPDPLWGAEGVDLLLLGQGVRPGDCGGDAEPLAAEHRAWLAAARRLAGRALPHADALAAFDADPALVDALAAPFLTAGPAFR
jgi:tryptophan halogenase